MYQNLDRKAIVNNNWKYRGSGEEDDREYLGDYCMSAYFWSTLSDGPRFRVRSSNAVNTVQ